MNLKINVNFEMNFLPDGRIFIKAYDSGGNQIGSQIISVKELFGLSSIDFNKSESKTMLKNIRAAVKKLEI